MKRNNKGFTLVELAVTVAIVIILMSVSVPIYKANTKKYKMTEAYALLAMIRAGQERYYVEHGHFLNGVNGSGGVSWKSSYTANEEVLGINARTNKYFTWFTIDSIVGYNGKEWGGKGSERFAAVAVGGKDTGSLTMLYDTTDGVVIKQ